MGLVDCVAVLQRVRRPADSQAPQACTDWCDVLTAKEMTMISHAHHDTRVHARPPTQHPLYEPARRHWPGVLAAVVVAAVAALLAVNETDEKDTLLPPPAMTSPAAPSNASPPTSERPTERNVEDTSGVIVTDEQPVDVSTPVQEDEPAPAQ